MIYVCDLHDFVEEQHDPWVFLAFLEGHPRRLSSLLDFSCIFSNFPQELTDYLYKNSLMKYIEVGSAMMLAFRGVVGNLADKV